MQLETMGGRVGSCTRCGRSGHYARNCTRPRVPTSEPGAHSRLPIKEKRSEARTAIRPSAMRCPVCTLAIQPSDLLSHLADRCEGRRPIHVSDRWATRAEVSQLGVAPRTVERWADRGFVRYAEDKAGRRYLYRDVVFEIALRMRRKRLTAACK